MIEQHQKSMERFTKEDLDRIFLLMGYAIGSMAKEKNWPFDKTVQADAVRSLDRLLKWFNDREEVIRGNAGIERNAQAGGRAGGGAGGGGEGD